MTGVANEEHHLDLPPGFRFHPTDEELISHYLIQKVMNSGFSCRAVGDVDLNKSEPWDLPWKAKMGDKEWYFFCVRDRKYPTGVRTNRATQAGYWKATGKDKDIYRAKSLVGMKKTLVFYIGRAPKGQKSGWVMHEYRLEGKFSAFNLPKSAKNEWVICRVFQKNSNGKKVDISGMSKTGHSILPPLTDSSSIKRSVPSLNNVPCFSIAMDSQITKLEPMASSFSVNPDSNWMYSSPNQSFSVSQSLQFPGSVLLQEQHSLLRALIQTVNAGNPPESFQNISHEAPPDSMAPIDLDGFWNYLN